ncbi:hypothetical protein [Streptomyces sp. NPDC048312]|uniref:hypothetical protein n=1 Tax=Streptomyces sp. NPDC048312 TaxID=3155485 RepID=UPI00340A8459
MPCTTDPGELAVWVRDLDRLTVCATYVAVGLGILRNAHAAGLDAWDLMVVDEAHRASGYAGGPWAVVHDQQAEGLQLAGEGGLLQQPTKWLLETV